MSVLTITGIAVGLAMDAFAVSIANGVSINRLKVKHAITIASFFGAFQAFMPVLGWFAGLSMINVIGQYDHWIAFGLLTAIGLRMIIESFKPVKKTEKRNQLSILNLTLLAIATSIDALAAGMSLSFIHISIVLPAAIIGTITFLLSFTGIYIGKKLGHFFEKRMEFIGGLILILIGLKILLEHLCGF